MVYVVIFGVLLLAVAAAVIAAMKQAVEVGKGREAALQAKLNEVLAERAVAIDAKARVEQVVESLKAEIEELEKQLATHNTPDAVRSRLRDLL